MTTWNQSEEERSKLCLGPSRSRSHPSFGTSFPHTWLEDTGWMYSPTVTRNAGCKQGLLFLPCWALCHKTLLVPPCSVPSFCLAPIPDPTVLRLQEILFTLSFDCRFRRSDVSLLLEFVSSNCDLSKREGCCRDQSWRGHWDSCFSCGFGVFLVVLEIVCKVFVFVFYVFWACLGVCYLLLFAFGFFDELLQCNTHYSYRVAVTDQASSLFRHTQKKKKPSAKKLKLFVKLWTGKLITDAAEHIKLDLAPFWHCT